MIVKRGDGVVEEHEFKRESNWARFLGKLRSIVIAGLVFTVPIGVTVWIIAWIFHNVDEFLQPIIQRIFGHPITGVGFGVTVVLILVVGLIATNVIGKRVVKWVEEWLEKIPISRLVYSSLRQLIKGFAEPGQTGYLRVVMVKFPTADMRAIAFLTAEQTGTDGLKYYTVFIPNSPNPATGYLQIVRSEDVTETNISIEDAFKMVVSAGRASPSNLAESVHWNGKTIGDQTPVEVIHETSRR